MDKYIDKIGAFYEKSTGSVWFTKDGALIGKKFTNSVFKTAEMIYVSVGLHVKGQTATPRKSPAPVLPGNTPESSLTLLRVMDVLEPLFYVQDQSSVDSSIVK